MERVFPHGTRYGGKPAPSGGSGPHFTVGFFRTIIAEGARDMSDHAKREHLYPRDRFSSFFSSDPENWRRLLSEPTDWTDSTALRRPRWRHLVLGVGGKTNEKNWVGPDRVARMAKRASEVGVGGWGFPEGGMGRGVERRRDWRVSIFFCVALEHKTIATRCGRGRPVRLRLAGSKLLRPRCSRDAALVILHNERA